MSASLHDFVTIPITYSIHVACRNCSVLTACSDRPDIRPPCGTVQLEPELFLLPPLCAGCDGLGDVSPSSLHRTSAYDSADIQVEQVTNGAKAGLGFLLRPEVVLDTAAAGAAAGSGISET